MIRQQLFIGAALIVGVAVGYFVKPEPKKASAHEGSPTASPSKLIEDKGDVAMMTALRARVRELESQLARADEGDEGSLSGAVEKDEISHKRREMGPGNPREWMENLKKNDPERYVQTTNRIARWRQNQRERQAERVGFLASVDASRMDAADRKIHESYQALLSRRAVVEERLQNENLEDGERREAMEEMFAIDREVRQTGSRERRVLLDEIARAVGLEGEDAESLVQTVNDVVDATGGGHHGGFFMPPPPGR